MLLDRLIKLCRIINDLFKATVLKKKLHVVVDVGYK